MPSGPTACSGKIGNKVGNVKTTGVGEIVVVKGVENVLDLNKERVINIVLNYQKLANLLFQN